MKRRAHVRGADGEVDWAAVSGQLVRALRGARTQVALSRALGYRTNVLFAWESGRDDVGMTAFLRLLRQLHRDPNEWLTAFGRGAPECSLGCAADLGEYLARLAGERSISSLAERVGVSRYVVGRWLAGKTEISLAEFLWFVEVTTLAALDLLALLVDPRELESTARAFARLEAARRSARERPWSHAIVHMVDLPSYRALGRHEPGWFASRLGISTQEERECLELLVELGRLSLSGGRYASSGTLAVDTRPDPGATRQLASFWMKQGAERVLVPESGRFAFNTFGISHADFERVRELGARYFRELRAIIGESEPTEMVAVATFQLFPLASEDKSPTAE